jgi:PAS domain S-box-containing protein
MKHSLINFSKEHRWLRRALLAAALSLCFLLPDCGFALDPGKSVFQYNCQSLIRQNGLPADRISTVVQSKDGYIWLGTQNGLIRFDGLEFKVIPINLPEAQGQDVRKLIASKDGEIRFAINNGGFGSYDGKKFSAIGDDRWSRLDMDAITILETRDSTLWTGAQLGMGRWVKGKPGESFFDETTNRTVLSLCEDPAGLVWLGTSEHGLYRWAEGKFVQISDDLLKKRNIFALAADSHGQIWAGTDYGLRCYSHGQPKAIPTFNTEVRALLVDSHGILWVGTSGMGLARYQNGVFTYLRKVDGLASDYVTSLFEDAEGSLWIGTQDGLSHLTDVKFPIYSSKEGISEGASLSVFASAKGGLWITTAAGVSYFDGETATNYGQKSFLSNVYIKLGFEARNGDVYLVDGDKNIDVLSGGVLSAQYTNQMWPSALAEDSEGILVAMGTGQSLFRVHDGTLRPYEYNGEQPDDYWINNLCVTKDGTIWVASNNGIFRIKDGHFKHWTILDGLPEAPILWICQDVDGNIWAASAKGIIRIKDDKVRNIKQEDGLYEERIFAIVPDDHGSFWFDSDRGIFRASRQSLNDFADGKTNRIQCEVFNGLESVKSTDSTDQENSGCKTLDGRIWFPSPWGVVMIDPEHILTNQIAPPVHIDRALVNGHEAAWSKRITVPLGKGELEFHFTALSFIAPQKIRVRYQLEGYDKDWVEAGDRRVAFYTHLRPGSYTFHVIAANADGVWNETGDAVNIELLPFYYQTLWFRLLCGGLAFAALVGVYLQRVNHLKLKQQSLQKTRDLLEAEILNRTAELSHERDLLRALMDSSPDPVYFKDAQSRFLIASKAHANIFGLKSADELLGKTDFDFFAEEHARPAFEDEQEIIRTGVPLIGKVEKEVLKNGRESWALTSKMPLLNKDGQIIGTFGISKDITAIKQAEAELAYQRDLLGTLMNYSPDSIFFKDLQSHFVRISRSEVNNLRRVSLSHYRASHPADGEDLLPPHLASVEEFEKYVIGKSDAEIYGPERAGDFGHDEKEIMRTGQLMIGKIEQTIYSDGSSIWYMTTKVPWRNKDGEIIGIFGTARDISDLKNAEAKFEQVHQQLQWKTAFLEAQVNSSIDGILVVDQETKMSLQNQRFVDLLKIPRHIADEKTDENRLRWVTNMTKNPEQFLEKVLHLYAHPDEISRDEIELKDGTILDRYSSPVIGQDGKYYGRIWTFHDITERKRLEARLFQSQKMETVGKLAGGVAHEFNSILTAIIGQSELLLGDLPAGSPLAKNATEISKAADRAATLTRQLLAYGRKQILQSEILDLNSVLAGMESTLRHLMGRDADVRVAPAAGLKAVQADAGQIEQVIMNIAINALDAMPNGGKLMLETANVSFDEESVGHYPELKPGDYVMLAITDTGTGMSAEVKARLFEPFFSTKGVGQGTGLGLSTCYGIIKQSGGHIAVYSELGRGTTFKIYLPQVEPQTKIPVQHLDSPDLPRGTETILLVEDDPALREMAATLLKRLGYTVLTAADGIEALSLKQQRDIGHIDLLFTDVVMPHMSGKELADRVQALYPHTKILFTSAYTENAIIHQGVLNKGVALLQKPFTPSALARKMREMLDIGKTDNL